MKKAMAPLGMNFFSCGDSIKECFIISATKVSSRLSTDADAAHSVCMIFIRQGHEENQNKLVFFYMKAKCGYT